MEKYIEAFIDVCRKVFLSMGNISINAENPFIMGKDMISNWDLSTIIGLSGDARGAIAISMRNDTALRMTSALTGNQQSDITDEVIDIVGEIINIIAGQAKQRMESEYNLQISLPIVTRGPGHILSWPGKNPRVICIPFKVFEKDVFYFLASVEPNITM
ncbi:MAG: chemotaxis protein CheX [Spirochaetaceae bacterium]|jgi:chemotaxis protein CheX|nr:chemotaxis protein CheX [Spirochaetaceae bacterium]